MHNLSGATPQTTAYLLYDGQCPLCSSFVQHYRLNKAMGSLVLLNARENSALKDQVTALGWDLDKGMVLKLGEKLYYGSDAANAMALMSSRSDLFNRINYWIFRSARLSAMLYPLCRLGRWLALKIKGTGYIANVPPAR